MDQLARTQGHHRFEWTHRKKSGENFLVEVTLLPAEDHGEKAILVIWRDLKQDTQVQKKLEQLHLLKTMINTVPGPASYISKDGVYLIVNESLCHLQGIHESQIIGQRVGFRHRADEFVDRVSQFLNSEDTEAQSQLLIPTSMGLRWHLVSMRKTIGSEPGGVVTISVDIHHQRQLEFQAEQSRKMAEYAARLSTLGEMAGGVAHEINNPLAVIKGRVDRVLALCAESPISVAEIVNGLENIDPMIDRIAKIVKGLKHFSGSSEREPVQNQSLVGIIEDGSALFKERFRRDKIEFSFENLVGDIEVKVQGNQISQVILNLLSNSFHAVQSSDRKQIRIEIFRHSEHRIGVAIVDSGPGVAHEVRDKIMQPFFTTKGIGEGTGLGLSVAKGIIEQHGGTLVLESATNPTRFEFDLPIAHVAKQTA